MHMELEISKLLSPARISLNAAPVDKMSAIDGLVSLHAESGVLIDPVRYKADVLLREAEGSTALGRELAIPHAKSDGVLRPALAAMVVPGGVEWNSPDSRRARLLFLIAAPLEGGDLHLRILARLMKLLIYKNLPAQLIAAPSPTVFFSAIQEEEGLVF